MENEKIEEDLKRKEIKGMYGVWFGLITGNTVGALFSLIWGTRTIHLLEQNKIEIRHS